MNHSTCNFVVKDRISDTSTRIGGQLALEQSLGLLNSAGGILLDFQGVIPTPSFIDQFLGGLVETIGGDRFRSDVQVINMAEMGKPLARHVLATRSRRFSPPRVAAAG